ncbi:MAG TPA: sigma-54 dependent transcriptional regulator [Kofleriaceae bacterium]|jgi:two-component system response regulator HydG|nr:sigma-54 dependent transcriptional regulator [Kofleriaceae bacterium]
MILIVDDHVEMARMLAEHLGALGHSCRVEDSGKAAVESLAHDVPDLVLTDLRMADVDGLDVLGAVHAIDRDIPVIVMTAFGSVENAVEAMRRGAANYVVKPIRLDELTLHVQRALEQRTLRREHKLLRAETRTQLGSMVGKSAAIRRVYDLIDRVAPSPAAVLLRGESGTGKELVARAIHDRGPRHDRAFVAVNCTALPEALLESELFGHTRGAFTGAAAARPGLIVEASGGTLFLDEIGDMAPPLQARLLRVLQEGEVRAVGSDAARHVDVRIIAATHQDLEARVERGEFRADLFYRLDVVPIAVPPLRDRLDDVPLLAVHFLERARARNPHAVAAALSSDVLAAFSRYAWPGNVRELENLIERLVVVGTNAEASLADLTELAPRVVEHADRFSLPRDKLATLREVEEEYIEWMLEQCGGNKTRAAEQLGIDPSTLHRRRAKH